MNRLILGHGPLGGDGLGGAHGVLLHWPFPSIINSSRTRVIISFVKTFISEDLLQSDGPEFGPCESVWFFEISWHPHAAALPKPFKAVHKC